MSEKFNDKALRALAKEHKNFLAVHRDNMGLVNRNAELLKALDVAAEALADEARGYRTLAEDSGCSAGNHDGGSPSTCEHCHLLDHAERLENLLAQLPVTPAPVESDKAGEMPLCSICNQPMPPGEDMFKFHGYSGPCPTIPEAKEGGE